ncbi:ABC-F family ATP-binding cassette domain-containing protein [Aerococcus kribbianus]|uniref:ABC-F family ATP-binding cassette domain-containing protein n=1 Tax=Aerococcus kribbianus TaxID=2999064 RepID=A0A9X3FTW5_9LACT|nr:MULTISPECIES: ABC-F family ATP-binding cassette domain-containing protein [unclassified Aerococcus]MCZ0716786.1 ABC-F family ATP-binding cassette domain-containing protein [Aerococcus sp. YH-aer221]MCZ0725074.1 ABC-F family ATP-binding cassette domain-containing protein [Aerococcus sp. YH-aer222]
MRDYKIEHAYKSFGMKDLIKDVSFLIREGDHIGLIGNNGSGKSTLLRVMASKDSFDQGQVEHAKDFSIAYVPQEANLDADQSIFEALYESDSPLVALVGKYEQATLALQMDPENPTAIKNFQKWEQEMNQADGWNLDTKIQSILNRLGITNLYQKVAQLSGGQRKRVNLAKALIDEPDLLLMDEPTNHLDFEMVEWLQNYIRNYKHSVLVVTHDRYFLDHISDRIFALKQGELKEYEGNYQAYLEKRAHEEEIAAASQAKQKKLYKSELAWMRKGAKARTTKQQARINRFEDLKADVTKPQVNQADVDLDFDQERLGKKVILLEDVTVGYPDKVLLSNINLLVQNRDRIGIIGDNGVGKTSLLNTIAGLQSPLAGYVSIGETVKIAYFRQLPADLPDDKRLITYIQEVADEYVYNDGRKASAPQMLEKFLFPRPSHGMKIGSLSGGEKKRLYLLKLLMEGPNVLFLDEPTNDLDIDTLTVLEDYLETFPGTVLTVSHDRYFLDKVVDKLLIAHGHDQSVTSFYGNYSNYQEQVKKAEKAHSSSVTKNNQKESHSVTPPEDSKQESKANNQKRRMTYQEKKDWETIEDDIAKLETEISNIEEEMVANGSDLGKLNDLQKEKESKEVSLLEKMEYWEYLSDLRV